MAQRVLVVEDDPDIQRMLARGLAQEGFEVVTADDGLQGLRLAHERRPDLVILDVMLPHLDGLALCDRLRRQLDLPIIMLTAKGQLEDRLAGLEHGADDYIVKPFSLQELLMRVKVQLRHRQRAPTLRAGDLVLDLDARVVRRGNREIALTTTEFLLVRAFMEQPGTVQSRGRLHEVVWGEDGDITSNLLEVYVARLRRKLEVTGEPPLVQTVRGVGYMLRTA